MTTKTPTPVALYAALWLLWTAVMSLIYIEFIEKDAKHALFLILPLLGLTMSYGLLAGKKFAWIIAKKLVFPGDLFSREDIKTFFKA